MKPNTVEYAEAFQKELAWMQERVLKSTLPPFAIDLAHLVVHCEEKDLHIIPIELYFTCNDFDYSKVKPTRGAIYSESDISFRHKPYPEAHGVELGHVTIGYTPERNGTILSQTRLWVGDAGFNNKYLYDSKKLAGAERLTLELAKKIDGKPEVYNWHSVKKENRPDISPFTSGNVVKVNTYPNQDYSKIFDQLLLDIKAYYDLAKEVKFEYVDFNR